MQFLLTYHMNGGVANVGHVEHEMLQLRKVCTHKAQIGVVFAHQMSHIEGKECRAGGRMRDGFAQNQFGAVQTAQIQTTATGELGHNLI